jgi:hypothetical protein
MRKLLFIAFLLPLGLLADAPFYFVNHADNGHISGPFVFANQQSILSPDYQVKLQDPGSFLIIDIRNRRAVTDTPIRFANGSTFSLKEKEYTIITGEDYEKTKIAREAERQEREIRILDTTAVTWALKHAQAVEINTSDLSTLLPAYDQRIYILNKTLTQHPRAQNLDSLKEFLEVMEQERQDIADNLSAGNVLYEEEWMTRDQRDARIRHAQLTESYPYYLVYPSMQEARDAAREINREDISAEQVREQLRATYAEADATFPPPKGNTCRARTRSDKTLDVHFNEIIWQETP